MVPNASVNAIAKTSLAWETNEMLLMLRGTKASNSANNSGASAMVNVTLKANEKTPKMIDKDAAIRLEQQGSACLDNRDTDTIYVRSTRSHSSGRYAGNICFAISGDPACFWPVWFQLRITRSSPRGNRMKQLVKGEELRRR